MSHTVMRETNKELKKMGLVDQDNRTNDGAETDGGSRKGEDATAKIVGVNTASDDDDSVPTKSDDTFTYVLCVSRGIDEEKVVNVI